ncbi:MogA/MoaB family molybdenum cofactor biosynthesis protein [Macrococcus equipercicus]|uniref:Molybdenum cofactor biosynthesis protein B n=1 Tax=Macrococcus equipercicus TaxID=69967 RepID=A0A9Q9BTC6_9STAP|nr:MogA/MoaB family molybdenum cofactor biosynthesis protein [Macrococcus equipercicus]UTH13959.1 MogA/MoaB family molybdenum cofactor biosynthesis protein [Macrococcus equipercicus]
MHDNIFKAITAGVLTVSDTRTTETDKGGQAVIHALEANDITVKQYKIVTDDVLVIQQAVTEMLQHVDAVITTGGTGVAQRDVTIEAVKPLVAKELEGFGELFRYLSFTEDVGTKAMLSRAFCGTAGSRVIFCLPGSVGAVNLAMSRLVTQEIFHIVYELNK